MGIQPQMGLRQPYSNIPPVGGGPQIQQLNQIPTSHGGSPQSSQYPSQDQQQPKMNMEKIPNPIEVMNFNNSKFGSSEIFETNEVGKMPSLITTDFICKDMGNANPRFVM